MPLQATSGAASYDAFGGGVAAVPNYIEDVFSTWLYTGNGTTQTINNGIDLAGKGGMVWGKTRDAVVAHTITDTVRGVDREIFPNTTDAQQTRATGTGSVFAFNSNGFSTSGVNGFINYSGLLEVAWTFREQAKFFDIVTYTGTGANRTISHNLGSAPGCIIVKRTNTSGSDWMVWHRGLSGNNYVISLNTTAAQYISASSFNSTAPTATEFSLGSSTFTNESGSTYVAYLFAHNAGGFGLTGTDNVISCGSFTQASGGTTVNLGYEPQWVLVKNTGTGNWFIFDNMRGNTVTLYPNLSNAEGDQGAGSFQYNATGFTMADYITGSVGSTLIYIAIRRGPMKVPTTGTSVLDLEAWSGNGTSPRFIDVGFPADLNFFHVRNTSNQWNAIDRLRGNGSTLAFNSTAAEDSGYGFFPSFTQEQNRLRVSGTAEAFINASGYDQIFYSFRRAPGFFDEVCYTGTGAAMTVAHNLTVVPELMIVKSRSTADSWPVYSAATGNSQNLFLNQTDAAASRIYWNNTTPTASVFSLGNSSVVSNSGTTYVAYLFASCPGVSKVGSYTGNGSSQVINCGFTGGARFVLIKSTTEARSWCVFDTARGIVSGNDPVLYLQSTDAEVTSINWLAPNSSGFEIVTSQGNINGAGQTYIYLAIA